VVLETLCERKYTIGNSQSELLEDDEVGIDMLIPYRLRLPIVSGTKVEKYVSSIDAEASKHLPQHQVCRLEDHSRRWAIT
jgi:hypothetical protein